MRRLRRLNTAQRAVLVVGLGALLLAGGLWWYYGEIRSASDGWFAYAPNSDPMTTDVYTVVGDPWRPIYLIVPVALIALWTVVSVWLLGLRPPEDEVEAVD